jgi:hypothetical protein
MSIFHDQLHTTPAASSFAPPRGHQPVARWAWLAGHAADEPHHNRDISPVIEETFGIESFLVYSSTPGMTQ